MTVTPFANIACAPDLSESKGPPRMQVAPILGHEVVHTAVGVAARPGRPSIPARSRISCGHCATDICNMRSPLFTGVSAMMQNLPNIKRR
jgi:hypothetical protein